MSKPMSTIRLAWELFRYRPRLFLFCLFMWTMVHGLPVLFGLLIGEVFGRLAGEGPALASPWTPVAVFTALALGRNGIVWLGDIFWTSYWNDQAGQLRRNLLGWLLEAPRSRVLPSAPGEAVSTFRDDVEDLLEYMENYVDLGGVIFFGVGSVLVMARIDPLLTAVILVPIIITGVLTQALSPQIRKRRRAMRSATEEVTGFIGETFAAVQAVKLARAEQPILRRFADLNRVRRKAALRDTVLTEILRSINRNMSTVGVALVLLIAAASIRDGRISVGELAIFLTYLPRLTDYMAFAGDIIAQHRRTGVAYERIRALAVDAADAVLLDRTRVPLKGDLPELPAVARPDRDKLQRLEVRALSYRHTDKTGIHEVDLALERGTFTAITGKVGSGKSTLVRAVLGLIPASGDIFWNGVLVEDPASFLIPPRSAYTPQSPRLFSESLADNITLGQRVARERLRDAVQLAVLDRDLEWMEQGIDTMVGARGVKLSGGQLSRSAAARMFATDADLLVFDDLSSALDLRTEAELWERLFLQRDVTCLVVSHRRAALVRADQIILMEHGRIVDRGRLAELLDRSELMRALWTEAGLEATPEG